jgi:hypothetical protein
MAYNDYSTAGGGQGGTAMTVNTGEFVPSSKTYYQAGSENGTVTVSDPYTLVPEIKNIDSVLMIEADLFNNDPARWQQLHKLYTSAGYSTWKEAVEGASMDANKDSRSFMQFLEDRAKNPIIQKLVAASGSGGSGGPFYSRDTSVNLSSLSEAAQVADQTFTQELGRTASDQEAAAFQKALNKQQQMNPQVSIQSGTQTKGSRVSQSKQTGGFDATRFAREYAQSQEGYGEHFAGVTFMDVIDKAISDPNTLDQIIAGG